MSDMITTQTSELATRQPLDQNPAAVYLAGLRPTGRRSQRQALGVVAEMLTSGSTTDPLAIPWAALRFSHVAAIKSKLIERYAPATVNRTLCAIRRTLKAAWRLGQLSSDDYQKAVDVEGVTGSTLPAGRELTAGELGALMADCGSDPTRAGARDASIIAMLYTCGLRRDEITALDLADFDPQTGKLIIKGKRGKERTAYLINGAADAMSDWLAIRGQDPGALFLAINKSGKVRKAGRLTNQAIYSLLAKRATLAGVKDFSPHDFRRTFVSDLLDAGADISTVARMAGHASVNTTARYDRRPEESKRKAAELLHVPYSRRKAAK